MWSLCKQHCVRRLFLLVSLTALNSIINGVEAFQTFRSATDNGATQRRSTLLVPIKREAVVLHQSSNQFDITKPTFDVLSLRPVRGDAIVRYDSLNQSEPLRINIFGLLTVACLAAPTLNEALGGDGIGLVGTVGYVLASVASFGLFLRECQRRSKQLMRIEKELNSQHLEVRLPTNALADMPFTKAVSLGALKQMSPSPRTLALCGTAAQLKEALKTLCVLGRRLQQASTFVVPVPTDGSSRADFSLGSTETPPWLADPDNLHSWLSYFDDLSSGESTREFRWFGLNSNGRSFGSGSGEVPQWLEVMGRQLRPTSILDEDDGSMVVSNDDIANVMDAQRAFYQALTSGNIEEMEKIFCSETSGQVSEVMESGGRIDDWNACLAQGARPEGMVTSGCDAFIVSDAEAYSTVIEFPANTGFDGATLLAVQQWMKVNNEWKLQLHQTIPWNTESTAQGTLRCDCRGCVALTRGEERRTFGGLIG